MKRKGLWLVTVIVAGVCLVTGCGDGTDVDKMTGEQVSGTAVEAETTEYQPVIDEKEQRAADLEYKYSTEGLNAAEYEELASWYGQEGKIMLQRDMYEQCWRLYGDVAAYEALQQIVVNVEEENDQVKNMAQLLMQNMDLTDYWTEAASTVYSESWYSTMMPKLKEGSRTYYRNQADNGAILIWRVGYDLLGKNYTEAWYQKGEQLVWLRQDPESVQMVNTTVTNGQYTGAFESWLCMSVTGDIYHESGNLQNNVLTGEYSAGVFLGNEPTDLIGLWSSRESMELKSYSGNFGENGIVQKEQPDNSKLKITHNGSEGAILLCYAWTEDEKEILAIRTLEGTEAGSYVFNATELWGMDSIPQFTFYAPVGRQEQFGETALSQAAKVSIEGTGAEKEADGMIADKKNVIDPENVQIRVFDSNIQWFDGTRWHTVGTVSEYEARDPFNEYTGRQSEVPGVQIGDMQDGENAVSSNQDTAYNKRCAGSIVTTTTTNSTGSKGNSNTNKGNNNTNKGNNNNANKGNNTNKGNTLNAGNTVNPGNSDTNNGGNTGSDNGGNNDSVQEPSQEPTQTPSTNPDSGTTQDPSNGNNNSSGSNGTNNQPSQGDTDVGWADVPD